MSVCVINPIEMQCNAMLFGWEPKTNETNPNSDEKNAFSCGKFQLVPSVAPHRPIRSRSQSIPLRSGPFKKTKTHISSKEFGRFIDCNYNKKNKSRSEFVLVFTISVNVTRLWADWMK